MFLLLRRAHIDYMCIYTNSWVRNLSNKEHRHSGIGLMTPESVHYGLAKPLYEHRKTVLRAAFKKTPNRFKGKISQPPKLPKAAWINQPSSVAMEV